MHRESPVSTPIRARVISPQDRLLDAVALLTLAAGVLVFAVGRASLGALAGDSYRPPPQGVTWVSRAEMHDRQTKVGLWLSGAGLILSVGAALRHSANRHRG